MADTQKSKLAQSETKPVSDKEKIVELTELAKRTQAQFENFRKQTEKRQIEFIQMASKKVLSSILPVMDNFELALKAEATNIADMKKGVELIHKQLAKVLTDHGVQELSVVGEDFDPHRHEALMKVGSKEKENTVIEEFVKGYMLYDKVLRPAKVKISGGSGKKGTDTMKNNNENTANTTEA